MKNGDCPQLCVSLPEGNPAMFQTTVTSWCVGSNYPGPNVSCPSGSATWRSSVGALQDVHRLRGVGDAVDHIMLGEERQHVLQKTSPWRHGTGGVASSMDWFKGNLQETMVFTIKYRGFLYIFPSSNSMTSGKLVLHRETRFRNWLWQYKNGFPLGQISGTFGNLNFNRFIFKHV